MGGKLLISCWIVAAVAAIEQEGAEEACDLQLTRQNIMEKAQDQTCSVGDHVKCPGSSTTCSGNQCCPRSTYGQTFPCPSADPAVDSGCESPDKQTDCLARSC